MSNLDEHSRMIQAGCQELECLEQRASRGKPPSPAELVSAMDRARALESDLAVRLEARQEDDRLHGAWLSAVELCEALAAFSLFLARRHGPRYLPV